MSLTIQDVRGRVTKWLYFAPEDVEIIDVTLAAAVAVRLPGERLWILLVDVPGSGKTELIRALRGLPSVHFLSTISPKTLISGFRPGGRDFSLLPKLDKKLLAIKDLTAIMDMPAEQQRQIFGTLRDAYDGFSDHSRGNMDSSSYDASFGLLAGCTDVIDLPRRIAQTELGDRYLKVRFHGENVSALTERAFENAGRELEMRQEISMAVQAFICGLQIPNPLPKVPKEKIIPAAQWVARMRTPVHRDKYHRISSSPKPEVPTRLVKQLTQLAQALAVVRGHAEATEQDIQTVWRVAMDTPNPLRVKVLNVVENKGCRMTVADISKESRLPVPTARVIVEDLWTLSFFDRKGEEIGGFEDSISYEISATSFSFAKPDRCTKK